MVLILLTVLMAALPAASIFIPGRDDVSKEEAAALKRLENIQSAREASTPDDNLLWNKLSRASLYELISLGLTQGESMRILNSLRQTTCKLPLSCPRSCVGSSGSLARGSRTASSPASVTAVRFNNPPSRSGLRAVRVPLRPSCSSPFGGPDACPSPGRWALSGSATTAPLGKCAAATEAHSWRSQSCKFCS